MAKRMSDTRVLCSPPANPSNYSYESKSTRKIDNGFVVSESCEKNGEYTSREYFTKSPDGRGPSAGPEALNGAIAELNK